MFFSSKICSSLYILIILIILHNENFCFARETISPTQLITDAESINSLDQVYRLGFFSPDNNSSNRYVGIWYNRPSAEKAVVWVANRQKPVTDSSGVLRINSDGNLVILDGRQNLMWTTNVSGAANSSMAELLDSGNFVLREAISNGGNKGRIIWQSFEHPTDTLLPDMRIGINTNTGEKRLVTSWKSNTDPSEGRFHVDFELLNIPQLVLWNGSQRHWRSGPWDGKIFIGVEEMESSYQNGFSLVRDDPGGNVYLSFSYNIDPVRYVLNPIGQLRQLASDKGNDWIGDWAAPKSVCQFYGKCGSFGVCNRLNSPVCSCLKGYEPKSTEEWRNENWSNGCTRRIQLQCEGNNTNGEKSKEDGFLKYERTKVPDFLIWVPVRQSEECKQTCLKNCSCVAYSFVIGIGCMTWHAKLIDMEMFSINGVDLYIRIANSELDKQKNLKLITVLAVLGALVTISVCTYIFWKWMMKLIGKRKYTEVLLPRKWNLTHSEKLDLVIPSFEYEMLAVSTDYFSLSNKLGEGGFGSVYKGKLPSGQEIAVKRLSKSSGQGIEEFKNEVDVISGLQHRNLVRLLGCCIAGEEKMLIYEYMPNKSLDAFLFDPLKKGLLEWRTCFQIIVGIGRGILYLHRDSRLKVIHRDLKPSNILLDKDLNPKISDFGMARIFGVDELQANTRRVVGTYGYMSPEYAMEGLFSEKSDVYSFGVLLLEIVTGLRNTGFYHHEESLSLIQHVWKLWNEDKTRVLINCTISEPSSDEEILRHIHVGLLCVQDFAKDRPTMSSVISMLTSEITSLPTPKRPTFTWRQGTSDSDSSYGSHKICSINNVSITTIGGR